MDNAKKILVIDDVPDIVEILRVQLEARGYKVYCAYDGEEGLKIAHQVRPDLVLLDISMPKKGGLHFYSEIFVSSYEFSGFHRRFCSDIKIEILHDGS
jgi:CheY-like chemotaxis protein